MKVLALLVVLAGFWLLGCLTGFRWGLRDGLNRERAARSQADVAEALPFLRRIAEGPRGRA